MTDVADALALLKRGTHEILLEDELEKKLASGRTLRIKRGSIPPRRTCIWGTVCY